MSALIVCSSNIKDRDVLLEALKKVGVPSDAVVVSKDELLQMSDRRLRKVDVLVKKVLFRGYRDVGFKKNDRDVYDILMDEDDEVKLRRLFKLEVPFKEKLQQWYAAIKTKKTLRRKGYAVSTEDEGTSIRIHARATA